MISPVVYYMSLSREGADSNKPLRFKFELPRQKNTYNTLTNIIYITLDLQPVFFYACNVLNVLFFPGR